MEKEYLTALDNSDNADSHLNSASTMQAQAHQEANSALTRAMAVYWSWIASGLLPSPSATTPETSPEADIPNREA